MLRRFWFEFEIESPGQYPVLRAVCGVTAFNYANALNVIREVLLKGTPLPPIKKVIEDVEVSTLDANHILPNIGVPAWRGIWYPNLNSA